MARLSDIRPPPVKLPVDGEVRTRYLCRVRSKILAWAGNPETAARWELIAIVLAVGLAWNTPVVWPLKILVVLFHELSHAGAAILTGGSVDHIEIVAQQGGLAMVRGGWTFLIYSAGYLGSMLWGALILIGASRTSWDRALAGLLGAILAWATIYWVRTLFGVVFGLAAAAALLACARWLSERTNDFILKTIGLTSCLYAVWDIWSDVLTRSACRSDARYLAGLTGVPTVVWGVLWIGLALWGSWRALILAARRPT